MTTLFRKVFIKVTGAVASFSAVLGLSAAAAVADSYSFRTVDPPYGEPGVDLDTQIVWINNYGVITVQYQSPRDPDFLTNMHTAALERGEWTAIDAQQAVTTGGTNANSRGQVVLSYRLEDDEVWHVAYHQHGLVTPIPNLPDYPGGTVAQGVNDLGQLAAVVIDADGNSHGLFGTAQEHDVFDFPDAVFTQANMINNGGIGVGVYGTADGAFHAFKWDNGELSNVDPPAAISASAIGVNNAGTIVGVYVNVAGDLRGYVQDGDEFADFEVPGSTFTIPYCINDRGQISGIYGDANGVSHGFVAATLRRGMQ